MRILLALTLVFLAEISLASTVGASDTNTLMTDTSSAGTGPMAFNQKMKLFNVLLAKGYSEMEALDIMQSGDIDVSDLVRRRESGDRNPPPKSSTLKPTPSLQAKLLFIQKAIDSGVSIERALYFLKYSRRVSIDDVLAYLEDRDRG